MPRQQRKAPRMVVIKISTSVKIALRIPEVIQCMFSRPCQPDRHVVAAKKRDRAPAFELRHDGRLMFSVQKCEPLWRLAQAAAMIEAW